MQVVLDFLHNIDLYKFIGLVVLILAMLWLLRPILKDCVKIVKRFLHIKSKKK